MFYKLRNRFQKLTPEQKKAREVVQKAAQKIIDEIDERIAYGFPKTEKFVANFHLDCYHQEKTMSIVPVNINYSIHSYEEK